MELSDEDRAVLELWARRPLTVQTLASDPRSAPGSGAHPEHCREWRNRVVEAGVDRLHDEPLAGAPREQIGDDDLERVVVKRLEETPNVPRTGLLDRWPLQRGCRRPRCRRSGGRSGGNRIWSMSSSCHRIRCPSTRSVMWSDSASTHPKLRWCCASTKNPSASIGPHGTSAAVMPGTLD